MEPTSSSTTFEFILPEEIIYKIHTYISPFNLPTISAFATVNKAHHRYLRGELSRLSEESLLRINLMCPTLISNLHSHIFRISKKQQEFTPFSFRINYSPILSTRLNCSSSQIIDMIEEIKIKLSVSQINFNKIEWKTLDAAWELIIINRNNENNTNNNKITSNIKNYTRSVKLNFALEEKDNIKTLDSFHENVESINRGFKLEKKRFYAPIKSIDFSSENIEDDEADRLFFSEVRKAIELVHSFFDYLVTSPKEEPLFSQLINYFKAKRKNWT